MHGYLTLQTLPDLFALWQYPPIDVYVSCLSNAMAAVLGLSVHGGVPVWVIEDDSVCSSQIDPQPPTTSWEDEAEDTLVSIEAFHQHLRSEESWLSKWI